MREFRRLLFVFLFMLGATLAVMPQTPHAQSGTPNNLKKTLLEAAKNGSEKDFEPLLRDGATPDVIEDTSQRTPLHYVVERGQIGMVRLLLERNANPNLKDRAGMTPLMITAHSANKSRDDIVRILIGAKADLDARSLYGDTAVRLAADKGYTDTVLLLIDNGASADIQSALNMALLRSAENGRLADVNQLLQRGANPNVQPTAYKPSREIAYRADTPLILAVAGGHEDVVLALLGSKANVNLSGSGGRTPLIAGVHRGPRYAKLLLERGAAPNLTDDLGRTPLMHVITSINSPGDQKELVILLKQAGADLDVKDKNGDSATRIAVANGKIDMLPLLASRGAKVDRQVFYNEARALAQRQRLTEIDALLAKGADPNVTDQEGRSALIIATASGRMEMMHALLQAGSSIDQQDKNGFTALMYAVRSRRLEATELLLSAKANTNIKNKANETALIIALPTRNESYAVRYPGNVAPQGLLSELMIALLKSGADPNVKLSNGVTPLIVAAARGAEGVVKVLLTYGADVNAKTDLGLTAYHIAIGEDMINALKAARGPISARVRSKMDAKVTNNLLLEAAWHGNTDLVRMLIVEDGADPNFQSQPSQQTPLYYGIRSGRASTVEALLKLGANPNVSVANFGTPLAFARKALKPEFVSEVVKVLVDAGAKTDAAK